jgi:Tol biopolymer transport system component
MLLWPNALPGGRRIVYTVEGTSGLCGDASVVVHDLETDERITVAERAGYGVYSPSGHILYTSGDGSVSAVPFDPDRMEITGPPIAVETGVWVSSRWCGAHYAVSEGGTFAFARGSDFENSILSWMDRNGEEGGRIGAPVTIKTPPRLSPDGTRIAAYVAKPGSADIYTIDTRTGDPRRITSGPEMEDAPVWSPDGRQLAYHSWREGSGHVIEVVDLEGSGQPRLVYAVDERWVWPRSWSKQGWLIIKQLADDGGSDDGLTELLAIRLDGSGDVLTVAGTEVGGSYPRFSPDGRWIAYVSYETGQSEIYVVPFPELDRRLQVSSNGGTFPRWSQTGDELFFYSHQDGALMSVRYTTDDGVFRWETPTRAFPLGVAGVSPDAQRFLVNQSNPDAMVREIHLVENWFQVMQEKEGRQQ